MVWFLGFLFFVFVGSFIASMPFVYGDKLSKGMLDGLGQHPIDNGFKEYDTYSLNSYLTEYKE